MKPTPAALGFLFLCLCLWLGLLLGAAFAEHPAEHQAIHERFYSTWMQPDAPWVSCCSNEDCRPVPSRYVDGAWWARWFDSDEWIPIPAAKVDEVRQSPDGRSHMCGRRNRLGMGFVIFCFVRGGGA